MTPPFFKWTVRLVATLFGIALVAVAALAIVMNTSAGTRWALARLDAALPGQLAVDDFEGTLLRGLRIPSLSYRDVTVEIGVSNFRIAFDWSTLPAARLSLDVATAEAVHYRSLMRSEPAPFRLSLPPLPLDLSVRRASIGQLVFANPDGSREVGDVRFRDAHLDSAVLRAGKASAVVGSAEITLTDISAELSGDVPASAHVQWQLVSSDWAGSGRVRGTLRQLAFNQEVSGPYPGLVTGTVGILERIDPQIDLVINWENWVFGEIGLADGELRLAGHPDSYNAWFDADVAAPRGLRLSLGGSASGNTAGLDSLDAALSGPAGSARASGTIAWLPALAGDLQVTVSDARVEEFLASLSGRVSVSAHVAFDDQRNVQVSALALDGVINGQPASARGILGWSPDARRCSDCVLVLGANRLRLDGRLQGNSLDARFDFDGSSLDQLSDDLDGRARARGQLTGTLRQPAFSGTASGRALAYAGWTADDVELTSRSASADALDMSVDVTNLRSAAADLGSFTVTGRGAITDLTFGVDWSLGDLAASAEGRLQATDGGYAGRVLTAGVTEKTTGTWQLDGPFGFRYAGAGLSVEAHSWVNGDSRLGLHSLEWRADALDISASLAELPLTLANPWLPSHLQLLGRADASVDLGRREGRWNGSVRWRQAGTTVRVAGIHDEVTDVIVPTAEFTAEVRDNALEAHAIVAVEPGVSGELDLRLTALDPDAELDAEFRLQGDDWRWVSAVIPQIDALQGSIAGRIGARGPLGAPEFEGDAAWVDGRLLVPALNVPLRDIQLRVVGGTRGSASLAGSARAGDGRLRVAGRAEDLTRPERRIRIEVAGDDAQLSDWPERRIWASPDLVIVGSPEGWRFDGAITMTRADIVMKELPEEAVTVSPDVAVIGELPAERRRTRFSGEALVKLGDQVRVNALGLDTALAGELRVRLPENRPVVAEGKISLVDAEFTAYGQKLTIREGELTFTGPLDDPLVDATAVRVIDTIDGEVTAGIRLRGRASDLTTTVFAEPAMADADALSYLVVGRPLSEATESEGADLSGAALSLGIKQAARLTEQIGRALNLDQLALAGDGGDATALIAGKQVNSRLYARYAYGVFSRLGVLLLRYRMSERLTLEAATGENQSIDVLYSVEKP